MNPVEPVTSTPRIRRPLAMVMAIELLVATSVPLAIGVWFAISRHADALAHEGRVSLALLADVTAQRIELMLVNSNRTLAQLAEDDRIVALAAMEGERRSDLTDAIERRLHKAAAASDDFALIMVLDREGAVIATTEATSVGQRYPDRPYFRAARAGESYVSHMILGRTTHEPGVFVSLPIRRGDDVVGVAVLKLEGRRIAQLVASSRPSDSCRAMLVDSRGVILTHTDPTLDFHSVGALDSTALESIDARADYGVDAIDAAPLDDIAAIVRHGARGAVEVALRDRSDSSTTEPWIVGTASLVALPWTLTVMMPRAEFMIPLRALSSEQALIALIVMALAIGYAFFRARGIVRPVASLTAAADRVATGDFDVRCGFTRTDELGQLGNAFDEMVPRLREHLELRQSIEMAMEVQQALLPEIDPALEGLDIAGRSRYCDETGGDYYDFIDAHAIGHDRMLIAVGDVMGHGIASALLMATARAALRAHAARHGNLGTLLTAVNRLLSVDLRHGRFMTMLIALADTHDGTIRWASAGHDPIIVVDPNGWTWRELEGSDLPLGVDAGTVYDEHRALIEAGQILLVGTDGIWETTGADGAMYGKERMIAAAIAAARAGGNAADVATAIESDLATYRGTNRAEDDVTFIVARLLEHRVESEAAGFDVGHQRKIA